jgi:hypothetical protein
LQREQSLSQSINNHIRHLATLDTKIGKWARFFLSQPSCRTLKGIK